MKDDNKSSNNEISITLSPKNYKYSLILKNNEIKSLKKEKQKNIYYINSLELELYNLKKTWSEIKRVRRKMFKFKKRNRFIKKKILIKDKK